MLTTLFYFITINKMTRLILRTSLFCYTTTKNEIFDYAHYPSWLDYH